jgi:hypothetical protein
MKYMDKHASGRHGRRSFYFTVARMAKLCTKRRRGKIDTKTSGKKERHRQDEVSKAAFARLSSLREGRVIVC